MRKTMIIMVGIILFVVAISGCTSNADPTTDIVLVGDLAGSANGPAGEWFVNGNVKSKSGASYSNVQLQLTAYDANNNVLGSKNATIADMSNGRGYFQTVIQVTGKPDHINMTVISATKA